MAYRKVYIYIYICIMYIHIIYRYTHPCTCYIYMAHETAEGLDDIYVVDLCSHARASPMRSRELSLGLGPGRRGMYGVNHPIPSILLTLNPVSLKIKHYLQPASVEGSMFRRMQWKMPAATMLTLLLPNFHQSLLTKMSGSVQRADIVAADIQAQTCACGSVCHPFRNPTALRRTRMPS